MKKTNLLWGIWNFVEATILLVAGILAIVYNESGADNQNLLFTIAFVVGSFVILDGLLRILMVVTGIETSKESIMLVGGFEITLGILIMIECNSFIRIVIEFLYVLLIVMGALLILFSILQIAKKSEKLYMPILEIVFAAILIALGIAVAVLHSTSNEGFNRVVLIVVGLILLVAGLAQAIITAIMIGKAKKKSKAVVAAPNDSPGKKVDKANSKTIEAEVKDSPKEIAEKK